MASFMEVLQTTRRSQTPLATIGYCNGLLAVYFEQHLHAGGILAATKEIQYVIDTINDGTLYLQGARTSTLRGKGTNWQIRC